MLTIYRYVTRDPPSVGQTPRHCCSHLRGSSPQVHRRKTQNYPDAETGRQWKRNVTIAQCHSCIVMHHRFVIILCYLKSLTFYIHDIYLYVYTVYGWMWLSLLHYTSCPNFFFFLFVFIKQIFKTEFSFTLLCKAQKWKCIYIQCWRIDT